MSTSTEADYFIRIYSLNTFTFSQPLSFFYWQSISIKTMMCQLKMGEELGGGGGQGKH